MVTGQQLRGPYKTVYFLFFGNHLSTEISTYSQGPIYAKIFHVTFLAASPWFHDSFGNFVLNSYSRIRRFV